MTKAHGFILIVLAMVSQLAALSCIAPAPDEAPVSLSDLPTIQYPGFTTFPTPRTYDAPGTVFRVNDRQEKQLVAKLDIPVATGEEQFVDYKGTGIAHASLLGKLLGTEGMFAGADGTRGYSLRVKLGDGHKEETFDTAIDPALKITPFTRREGWRYYVIRETIGVDSIDYKFLRAEELSAGAKAALDKLTTADTVQLQAQFAWADAEQSELRQRFSSPHRLFYKVDEVVFDSAALPAGSRGLQGITEQIDVSRELAAPPMVRALKFTYHTGDEDKDNDGSDVGATVLFSRIILADGVTEAPGDREQVWPDDSIRGPFVLALSKPVPWSEFDQLGVQIWHSRERKGGPAWRFKVQVDAELADGSTRRVLDFDDPVELFDHKPENRKWWAFDLRGPQLNTRYTTRTIPLRSE